nr:unnamed protein product [Spirometra erinaceieuropaei]
MEQPITPPPPLPLANLPPYYLPDNDCRSLWDESDVPTIKEDPSSPVVAIERSLVEEKEVDERLQSETDSWPFGGLQRESRNNNNNTRQNDHASGPLRCQSLPRMQSWGSMDFTQENAANAGRSKSIVGRASQMSVAASARSERSKSKIFMKVDEIAEAEEGAGASKKSIYTGARGRQSRYSRRYGPLGETDDARSRKITAEARKDIKKMHEIMRTIFDKIAQAEDLIVKRDFSVCDQIIEDMQQFQSTYANLIGHLRYSPYKEEMDYINECLMKMIDELEIQPPFVLLRLVEFGYHVYEIGQHIREDLIPGSFTLAIHTIQSRIYRLHTGRVIRQIYYVPQDFDPVVATYFKSRRLIRIESFCHCRIVLLDPSDPRCNLCPDGYRTIEVNFHEEKGRYLGFANLLNAVATSKIYTARVVATVFRRLSGVECDLSPEDLLKLESAEPRQTYYTLRSDLKSGTGTALAPKIDSV